MPLARPGPPPDAEVVVSGRSDETGVFDLSFPPDCCDHQVDVVARQSGLLRAGVTGVEVTSHSRPLRIEMTSGLSLRGTVVDQNGSPVSAVKVLATTDPALRSRFAPMMTSSMAACSQRATPRLFGGYYSQQATSNDRGSFEIRGLARGCYNLNVIGLDWVCDPLGEVSAGDEGIVIKVRRPWRLRLCVHAPQPLATPYDVVVELRGHPKFAPRDTDTYTVKARGTGCRWELSFRADFEFVGDATASVIVHAPSYRPWRGTATLRLGDPQELICGLVPVETVPIAMPVRLAGRPAAGERFLVRAFTEDGRFCFWRTAVAADSSGILHCKLSKGTWVVQVLRESDVPTRDVWQERVSTERWPNPPPTVALDGGIDLEVDASAVPGFPQIRSARLHGPQGTAQVLVEPDAEGRFVLRAIPAGSWTVGVAGGDGNRYAVDLALGARRRAYVKL